MVGLQRKSKRIKNFRRCYTIVLIVSVFGWGAFDVVAGLVEGKQDQDFYGKFRDEQMRSTAFEIAKVLWLVLRFVPISLLGFALF